jgi:hypothetical protein
MALPQYGDYHYEIYTNGLDGQLPRYPVDFASLERAAAEVLPSFVQSYVAGGCGDEGTQRANVDAFSRYAIVPRMLVGASERDLSVSLFDMQLPTPLFLCPIGVIGLCSQALSRRHRSCQGLGANRRTDGGIHVDPRPP